MASTTATWYRNGAQQSGGYVGCVGYDGGPVVGRFAFTTGSTGASSLSFQTGVMSPEGSTSWSSAIGPGNFRFAIATSSTANISKVGTDGYAVGVEWNAPAYMHSDGTKSVQLLPNTTYYLWIYPASSNYNLWRITSVSVTLSGSYGNPASPSASNGNFGSTVGITISGGSSGASYTVTASCGGHSETLQTKGTSTYLTWTPALATYGPLLPNVQSATATITVETFYGSLGRGTQQISITLSFRSADVCPTISSGWYSHAPYNESNGSSINKYIAGISKARITFDSTKISGHYGASISSYSVTCGGITDSASPHETPILTAKTSVTVKATDSRGFTASETFEITPLSYASPSLSQVNVFRCDSTGVADEDGAYYSVTATATYSSLEGENTAQILRYQKTASGAYGSGTALQSGDVVVVGPIDPDTIYDIKIEITDTVGKSGTVTRRISSRIWAMRFRESGRGVAFGMSPQADKRLELPDDWAIVIGNTSLTESELQALKALLS